MSPILKPKVNLFKNSKAKEEDATWVLEGIVGYLRSPSWNAPVMNFFDENCGCFEDKEENKFEYTDIHIKYKSLVEHLLLEYITELNISEDLFSQACSQHNSTINGVEGMFEYIWAADDFLLFKRLMSKHNADIEMQAFGLHLQEYPEFGIPPPINEMHQCTSKAAEAENEAVASSSTEQLTTDENGETYVLKEIIDESQREYSAVLKRASRLEEKEAEDLKRAIHRSKREMERLNSQAEEERRMLEEAIRLSLSCGVPANTETVSTKTFHPTTDVTDSVPVALVAPIKSSDKTKPSKKESHKSKSAPTSQQMLPPLRQKTNTEAALDWITSAQVENSSSSASPPAEVVTKTNPLLVPKPSDIDAAELAKRKEYLKAQREKLLEVKRKQREEELKSYQSSNADSTQKQLKAKEAKTSGSNSEGDKMINARRALAERLKREVIQKKR